METQNTSHSLILELLANLKTMTDLAERYGAGNDCDGNIIEAREVIAKAECKAQNILKS